MASTDEMIKDLTTKMHTLRDELIEMERNFNLKKEQFLKIQGALEALTVVQDNANGVSKIGDT
tara:strand:+ start:32 stop:220 length:189 start_codon:yes stop_codon:yes gene_type:complete